MDHPCRCQRRLSVSGPEAERDRPVDAIDVWYSSPAKSLIQDPVTKTVVGVTVERDGKEMNIRALNGRVHLHRRL